MITEQALRYVKQWKAKVAQLGDFRVIPVEGTNYFDVFQGEGWKIHSRVLVKDFVRVIKGEKIHPKLLYRMFEAA